MHQYMDEEAVEHVDNVKYLGVHLDFNIISGFHISRLFKKSFLRFAQLRKARYFINHFTALFLYKSLILPHIDYCNMVDITGKHDSSSKLQIVQNVACRILLLPDIYIPAY